MNVYQGPLGQLPNDVIWKVFSHLSVRDRFRLRCCSTRFRDLIDLKFKIAELLVCPDLFGLTDNRWRGTFDLINYCFSLVTCADFVKDCTMLQALQKLKVAHTVDHDFMLTLTKLQKLERLEVSCIHHNGRTEWINLPQLTFLRVDSVTLSAKRSKNRELLFLNTPCLKEAS